MADIPGLVRYVARAIAEQPDQVDVTVAESGRRSTVKLSVAENDMGRVIGREGRVANALRALISAAPDDVQWGLEIRE